MRAARGRQRGHEAEHESHERWLVTYADMLTLLMVLFVVLYAISQVDSTKFHELSSSLASAFNGGEKSVFEGSQGLQSNSDSAIAPALSPVDVSSQFGDTMPSRNGTASTASGSPTTAASPAAGTAPSAPASTAAANPEAGTDTGAYLLQLGRKMTDALAAAGLAGSATTSLDQRGLVVSVVTSNVVFAGNSADLEIGGRQVLDVLGPQLVALPNPVEIDGHTNQQAVSTYPFPSGWELSAARAAAVVRYLVGLGVASTRLTAVGMSDQRPLYPPSDPRSITLNRRVDIVVLSH